MSDEIDLKKLFQRVVVKSVLGSFEQGKLGKKVAGSDPVIYVTGKKGKVWVTRRNQTWVEARVKGLISYEPDYPVEFRLENGEYVIYGKSVHPSMPIADDPGINSFLALSDTPDTLVGQAGKFVVVNPGATALEFQASNPWLTDWSFRSSNRSTSAFAWKGNEFTPYVNIQLNAIAYYGTLVASAVYQAAVVTGTATPGNIATIVKSATVTLPGTLGSTEGGWLWLKFASPVTLTAGTVYGLMVGRTNSTDTYALPVAFNGSTTTENAVPMTGLSHGRNWTIPKANPTVGDAITRLTSNSVGMGFQFRYP